jgi:hypothetical protein
MWIEQEPAPDVEGIHHDSVPQARNHLLWDDHICNWSQIYKSHFSHSTEEKQEIMLISLQHITLNTFVYFDTCIVDYKEL